MIDRNEHSPRAPRLGRARWPRLMLALVLALGALATRAPIPARAATITVINTNNAGGGSLRQAILDSLPGGTIDFDLPGSGPWQIDLQATLPVITKELTIKGPGRDKLAIRGDDTFRLLLVNASDKAVVLRDLTLTKGRATGDYGGNIRSIAGNLALTDVALTAGSANAGLGGAGAYLTNGTFTLTRVVVSGNSAPGNANFWAGAGLHIDEFLGDTSVAITESTIADNHSTYANGGGIAIKRDSGTVGRTLSVQIVRSTISGNSSNSSGGGIYVDRGTLALTNSTVSGNTATNNVGGGLSVDRSAVTLDYVTLVGNTAKSYGGGIYAYGDAANPTSVTTVRSIIAGNTAINGGECGTTNGTDTHFVSQGYNVVGSANCGSGGPGDLVYGGAISGLVEPTLGPNGGYTRTHLPAPGSPARNRIPVVACGVATDQRGVQRPQPVGTGCDSGAVEATTVTLALTATAGGTTSRNPLGGGGGPFAYLPGSVVTLTPVPNSTFFVGWMVDNAQRGWANPLTITMNADHIVQARFAAPIIFPDVAEGRSDADAIAQLAARGYIRGYANGNYGPDDGVTRAQMAALIARATPKSVADGAGNLLTPPACTVAESWDCELWPNSFTDRGTLVAALWNDVAALQHYGVSQGYNAADCAARGAAAPCFGPNDSVSYAQTISFITRAMVAKGYWLNQPGAAQPYAGVPATHALDFTTFHYYTSKAGGIPAPPADWNGGATRGWLARALWQALNQYWGTDGLMADGRPAGGYVP